MINTSQLELMLTGAEVIEEVKKAMAEIEDEFIGENNTPVEEIVEALRQNPEVTEKFDEEEINRMSLITMATAGKCAETSRLLALRIQEKLGDRCSVQLLYCDEGLNYFFDHTVAVIKYGNKFMLASPANPLNLMHTVLPRRQDGTVFWRHEDVIEANTLEEGIERLKDVEGGSNWKLKKIFDDTNPGMLDVA
ncbi:MAG: hypothetical protein ABI721_02635 [Candidatus Dojkabacteria bacterium]